MADYHRSVSSGFKLEGTACIQCCCLGVVCAVDIAALAIGFQEYDDCTEQGSVMEMSTFCIMAGFIGIALALSGIVALFSCPIPPNGPAENMKKSATFTMCTALVLLVISIIGFVNYDSADDDCKATSLGKMVLAWCIIRIIGGCCGCMMGGAAIAKA